jgi:type I restriction enzyme M protein
MDDMDTQAEELGGKRSFFTGAFSRYAWSNLLAPGMKGEDTLMLYRNGLDMMPKNPDLPALFRDIFKNAYLPYRDPETLRGFLKEIDGFTYEHSERLGDAFEYLLSVLGSQGDAGQFRTPRHIIDFLVALIDPQKHERILDPACGTAGFLISAWKHIYQVNSNKIPGDKLSAKERVNIAANIHGYDISPDMVRMSLVNLYLHGFPDPHIHEYDTLTSTDRWNEHFDVILANPPFMSPKGGIKPHKKFSINATRSEVLFVDYIAEHLTPNGRAAIVVPEGIIFHGGTVYKKLRKMLVESSLVSVVSLPAGVFNPYSSVKTSVLIFDKRLAKRTDRVLFLKVNNDGFGLGVQRREMSGSDLPRLVQLYIDFKQACMADTLDAYSDTHRSDALLVERSRIGGSGEWSLSADKYNRELLVHRSKFPMVTIGSVCDLFNGRGFKSSEWETEGGGGLPIVRIQNLNNKKSKYNYFSGSVSEKNKISNGDLLFSWSGSRGTSFGAHIWNGEDAALNQHIFKVVFNRKKVTRDYLYLALNRVVGAVEENLHGGVGLVHITKGNLERIEIPLPQLEVQELIVSEINGFKDRKAELEKEISEVDVQISDALDNVWGET